MNNWKKISLYKFQQIDAINKKNIDELDKILFTVCVVYNMTEYELDHYDPIKAGKLCKNVAGIFSSPFETKHYSKIGKYQISYDPFSFRFGQYRELAFYMSDYIQNAHKIMASISNEEEQENSSADHGKKSEYFSTQPINKIIGSIARITEKFSSFNNSYKWLFGLDSDVHDEKAMSNVFHKKFGWVYAAESVASYERIKIQEVDNLSTVQVFNDLAYLKAKSKYETELFKKK